MVLALKDIKINGTEQRAPQINPHIRQLIFDNGGKNIQGGKILSLIKVERCEIKTFHVCNTSLDNSLNFHAYENRYEALEYIKGHST